MFVELHAQSAFSFLEAAEQPEALVAEAARLDMGVLALMDRDGLYRPPLLPGGHARRPPPAHRQRADPERRRATCRSSWKTRGLPALSRLITLMKMRARRRGRARPRRDRSVRDGPCLSHRRRPRPPRPPGGRRPSGRARIPGSARGIFGASNCFVEIQRHFDRSEGGYCRPRQARARRAPAARRHQPAALLRITPWRRARQ